MLELSESRARLREILGEDVNLFCFPYGASSGELLELCRRAGYRRVFTCAPQLTDPRAFALGRTRVDPTDWRLEFHLKLMGAYRWLPAALALKQQIFTRLRRRSPDQADQAA